MSWRVRVTLPSTSCPREQTNLAESNTRLVNTKAWLSFNSPSPLAKPRKLAGCDWIYPVAICAEDLILRSCPFLSRPKALPTRLSLASDMTLNVNGVSPTRRVFFWSSSEGEPTQLILSWVSSWCASFDAEEQPIRLSLSDLLGLSFGSVLVGEPVDSLLSGWLRVSAVCSVEEGPTKRDLSDWFDYTDLYQNKYSFQNSGFGRIIFH